MHHHDYFSFSILFYFGFVHLFICNGVNVNSSESEVVARIEGLGEIKGTIMIFKEDKKYIVFRGIQYAEAPIGELRFKPPKPFIPRRISDEPYDATKAGPECINFKATTNEITGQEDCLFLNVYTPNVTDQVKREVLVYIQGGSFSFRKRTGVVDPDRILGTGDFVLVTLNYRLHVFGFLSTDDNSPGNYGFLDQLEALRWITKNIHAFGGDPDEVTIIGESSGGSNVFSDISSPISTGLFKAVAMSGIPVSPWNYESFSMKCAKRVARNVGCPDGDSNSMMECLRKIPAEFIMISLAEIKTGCRHAFCDDERLHSLTRTFLSLKNFYFYLMYTGTN